MMEDQRVARLEAEVRHCVEMQKSAVTTELYANSLRQVGEATADGITKASAMICDKMFVEIDSVRQSVCEQIYMLSEKCAQLATKTDRCFGLQQQQGELNETVLEIIGSVTGQPRLDCVTKSDKETSIDALVDVLEETNVGLAGDCGIESDKDEACVVCGIEGEAGAAPQFSCGNVTWVKESQDNGSQTTTEGKLQRFTSGCRPISTLVRASSSSTSDSNTRQLLSMSASIFGSPLENIFRQTNSIRSGSNMRQIQVSCNPIQKSFLAEAWLQYRQHPRGMLEWLDRYMDKAFESAEVKSNWFEVESVMDFLSSSYSFFNDGSDESEVNDESGGNESD